MKASKSFTKTIQTTVARGFLPGLLITSVGAYYYALQNGLNAETAVLAVGIVTFLLALMLERLMPFRTDWNLSRSDVMTDWSSFVVLAAAAEPLLKATMALIVVAAYGHNTAVGEWFASALPLSAQIIVATLMIELGKYASHRWHHASPALWWLHALHHGSQRLVAVNNFRYHPLNYAINQALSMLPLMLLGAPAEVLLGYLAVTQPIVMMQHANIDLRNGWLNLLLSTPEVHRWHHSSEPTEGDRNFGNALLVWDHVFGTYCAVQQPLDAPSRIGLYGPSNYPAHASYVTQLLSAFTPACCKAGVK